VLEIIDRLFAALNTSIAAVLSAVIYRYVCIWENALRDKAGTVEGFDNVSDDDFTNLKKPQFRYTL
jgi:hypothetical protein